MGKRSLFVAACLDGNTIIAGVEVAIFDYHIRTVLWVAAIVVGAVAFYRNSIYRNVARLDRVYHPKWRIDDLDALNEYLFTIEKFHEGRT